MKSSLFLDYDFLSLIVNWQSGNNVDGKFYLVDDEKMEDGFCFIFLTQQEFERIKEEEIFRVAEIDPKGLNIWVVK